MASWFSFLDFRCGLYNLLSFVVHIIAVAGRNFRRKLLYFQSGVPFQAGCAFNTLLHPLDDFTEYCYLLSCLVRHI